MDVNSIWTAFLTLFRLKRVKAKTHKVNLTELCNRLNYNFKDSTLLLQALKHRSYLTQSGESRSASNERLELLGDSVLGFIVTEYLFKKYPEDTEGILTSYKSLLVSGRLLAEVASDVNLGEFVLLNESEARSGGRKRKSIISDAVESIIGAIYLDSGIDQARQFVYSHITNRLDSLLTDGRLRNYKSLLQEHCQSSNRIGPVYRIEDERGPDHQKIFTVSAIIDGKKVGVGTGSSKKKAEQNAASSALKQLSIL